MAAVTQFTTVQSQFTTTPVVTQQQPSSISASVKCLLYLFIWSLKIFISWTWKLSLQVVLKLQRKKQNHLILPTKHLLAVYFELLLSITYKEHLYPLLPPFLHTQTTGGSRLQQQKMNDKLYLVRWQRSFPRLQGDTPAVFPQDSPLTSLLKPPSILRMAERGKKNKQKPHQAEVISYCLNLCTEQLSPWEVWVLSTALIKSLTTKPPHQRVLWLENLLLACCWLSRLPYTTPSF